ncbi:MAG: hypothetical protein ACRC5M_03200, partial [Anaeroplasmataceae bacterium]
MILDKRDNTILEFFAKRILNLNIDILDIKHNVDDCTLLTKYHTYVVSHNTLYSYIDNLKESFNHEFAKNNSMKRVAMIVPYDRIFDVVSDMSYTGILMATIEYFNANNIGVDIISDKFQQDILPSNLKALNVDFFFPLEDESKRKNNDIDTNINIAYNSYIDLRVTNPQMIIASDFIGAKALDTISDNCKNIYLIHSEYILDYPTANAIKEFDL